jgi:glutamine amidotransferase
MCRHLAYLGRPTRLGDLLFDRAHALAVQARCPRFQISGRTNPDGWGVAWYSDAAPEPQRYRTVTPIWDDQQFATRARSITSGAVVAAARLASPGAALAETGNAPFVSGRWAFSLNGIVHGFTDGAGDELRSRLTADRRAGLAGDADTEVLFALVLQLLDRGATPADALATVVQQVLAITTGRLNLLLTDGHHVVATRVGNSLFRRESVIASEPIDGTDDGWIEVPDHSVVVLDHEGTTTIPLEESP